MNFNKPSEVDDEEEEAKVHLVAELRERANWSDYENLCKVPCTFGESLWRRYFVIRDLFVCRINCRLHNKLEESFPSN